MIYDCFMYFNEIYALDIRVEELWDVVDQFVIVRARHTFAGKEYEPQLLEITEAFPDKFITVWVDELLPKEPFKAEAYVRNAIMRGLTQCEPDDLIIISDADEIPRASSLERLEWEITALSNTTYYYTLDWKVPWDHYYFPVALSYKHLDQEDGGITPQKARYHPDGHIADAGWHFSCLGSAWRLQQKLQSFAHFSSFESMTLKQIDYYMRRGQDIAGRGSLVPVNIDESYPECITSDPDRWQHLLRGLT